MKKLKMYSVMALIALTGTAAQAQKLVAESGNLKFLAGVSEIKFEYDFKDMDVGKEGTEAEYTAKKVAEINKKKPGEGDKWLEKWNNDKMATYQPMFESTFNKMLQKYNMKGSQNATDTKYTCIVKTMSLYPGYNVGVSKMPAYVNFSFVFYETGKPDNVVAKFTMKKVAGDGGDYGFDVASRVKMAYYRGAAVLAKNMIKQVPLKKAGKK
jgi:hypothetical protein